MHEDEETKAIRIMAVTWNMHGGSPSTKDLDELFVKDRVYHDMYVFGT